MLLVLAGDGGPDAFLVHAVPELHQALAVEPQVGYAPLQGLFHDGAGAGAQPRFLPQLPHALDVRFQIVCRAGGERLGDAHAGLGRVQPHGFLDVAEHHVVHAVLAGAARASETGVHAGQRLDLQGDVLNDVPHPGTALHPLKEAPLVFLAAAVGVQRRQQLLHAPIEAGDLVRGAFLHVLNVQPHHHQLVAFHRPVVGATHGLQFKDPHRRGFGAVNV
jgi:hypothetical protein